MISPADLALDAAAVMAVLGAVGGLGVPALIAWIPEPPPEEPESADDSADAVESSAEVTADVPADVPAEEPKELYAAIAALPGLGWKAAVASALAAGTIGATVGWSWSLPFLLYLSVVGTALTVVDWRTRLLPTKVVAPSYAVVGGLVLLAGLLSGDTDSLVRACWGWLVAGGLFWLMNRIYPRGMGYGDVRLSGVLGIALGYLGWGELLIGVYGGFVLGAVVGTLLSLARIVDRKAYPFGPFMLAGAWFGVLFGAPIVDAYLGAI